jgi:putative two-component system response regulator
VALADVYDALTSKRSYKDALSHEEAARIIVAESGTHFDPDIVDIFTRNQETFRRIQVPGTFSEHPESIADILNTARP